MRAIEGAPASRPSPPPLRIGILVDSLFVPAWIAKTVQDIQNSSFAAIALVVVNTAEPPPAPRSLAPRCREAWDRALYNRYKSWDHRRHRAPQDAFEETDLRPLLAGAPVLPVCPARKRFVDRLPQEAVARIRAANLSVLFRFGFRILRGDVLTAAAYGVWSFHHGDNREYRGSAAGFWEMYERNPVTGTILQVLTESLDAGHVIYRSWSATDFGSHYASVNPIYWKTADFAVRRLRDLHRNGWQYLESLPDFNETNRYSKPIYHVPAAPAMSRFLARDLGGKLWRRACNLVVEEQRHWSIAYRPRSAGRTVLQDSTGFRQIRAPRDRFYADPFLIERDGKTYLFFEDFDYTQARARIAYIELGPNGPLTEPRVALDADCHLSYPFIFQDNADVYMIPETKERQRIELYRAGEFPGGWKLTAVLVPNVLAVDATLHCQAGRYWLFANIAVPGASAHDELHLFMAENIAGPYLPHPGNPVVSDVRRARPAGALFVEDGVLMRPSQDCSIRYGRAINFNQVDVLNETEYRERPQRRLEANWAPGLICTHTYNRSASFEVLDGMRFRYHGRPLRYLNRG